VIAHVVVDFDLDLDSNVEVDGDVRRRVHRRH